jgi:predicted nuclease of predicted toxin-antitoxin system
MRLLLDMNLSPTWGRFLKQEGFEAIHWSSVGDPTAADATIMEWARVEGYVVFTHDLDFSALLASVGAVRLVQVFCRSEPRMCSQDRSAVTSFVC